MGHLTSYTSMLVPVVLGVVLIIVAVRILSTIVKVLALAGLVAMLIVGYLLYSRIHAIQQAVDTSARQASGGLLSRDAFQNQIQGVARSAARDAGLDPNDVHVTALCDGPNTKLTVRYTDQQFFWGVLDGQNFTVPVPGNNGC